MARALASSSHSMHQILGLLPSAITSFIAFTAIFSIFAAVIFLCGGHQGLIKSVMRKEKTKTVRLGGEKKKPVMEKVKSSLSSKSLLMSQMISWRKVDNDGGDGDGRVDDQDDVVWKKTIIKGEKCRPIDFSGKILYDVDGNLID